MPLISCNHRFDDYKLIGGLIPFLAGYRDRFFFSFFSLIGKEQCKFLNPLLIWRLTNCLYDALLIIWINSQMNKCTSSKYLYNHPLHLYNNAHIDFITKSDLKIIIFSERLLRGSHKMTTQNFRLRKIYI